MILSSLTPQEIEDNKRLGLHSSFWETARPIPTVITSDWLDQIFPSWRAVGQEIVNTVAHSQAQICERAS